MTRFDNDIWLERLRRAEVVVNLAIGVVTENPTTYDSCCSSYCYFCGDPLSKHAIGCDWAALKAAVASYCELAEAQSSKG